MTPSIESCWKVIENVLREYAPRIFKALVRPASKSQIEKLEATIGRKLPPQFVESLAIHNGLRRSYLETNRLFNYEALLSTTTIAKQWKMMRNLTREGHFDDLRCSLTKTRKLKNDSWWREGWIPITDADGSGYCVDLDPADAGETGQIFYFYHNGVRPRSIVAENYGDWLSSLARKLHNAEFDVDQGNIYLLFSQH